MQQAAVAHAVQNQAPFSGERCLIIEDSHFDHRMMARVLARSQVKMQVQVATSLQVARKLLSTKAFSLILLDNNLPDGNGANFALELAEDPKLKSIPVIMVSDWPTPFMWAKATKAGVLHVVNKSEFTVTFLQNALRQGLKKRLRLN